MPSTEQFEAEVHEHRMRRLAATQERINDSPDRLREENSWPEEIRWARFAQRQ